MTTPSPSTPTPRRRWLQFSLRTLMVLMLVFGAGFGWFAREVQRARARREAAKTIEKLGGRVTWQPPSGGIVQTAVTWVGKLFGEDFSGDVVVVDLSDTQVTDAGLVHLDGTTGMWHLYLSNTRITDEGVAKLQKAFSNCSIHK